MAITAQQIIDRTTKILIDLTKAKFPVAELLLWISDAQRQVVLLRPDANVTVGPVTLVTTQCQQDLPSGALRLLDVFHNGVPGTEGNIITIMKRHVMDANDRGWMSSTIATSIDHIIYDDRFPTIFFTSPRPNGALVVTVAYSVSPAELTAATDPLGVPDIYESPIVDWTLYRCLSKMGASLGDASLGDRPLAAGYHDAFFATMGAKAGVDLATSPNWASTPQNPNQPTIAQLGS